MTSFNDRFGGNTVNPAEVAYKAYSLSSSLVTFWPPFAEADNVLAKSMDVTPLAGSLVITLPDAREASTGEGVVWYNNGAFAYSIVSASGTPVATISPGERRLIILADNTTLGGFWLVTLLGVGTGNLDVAGAAGAGLLAIGTTLNVAFPVATLASSRALTSADRDRVLVWTGGTGTLTLPLTSVVADFNFELRNQGTGAVTLAAAGGELIDGVSSLIFNNSESALIRGGTGSWVTVGRGRNASFAFTQLVKPVTGGTVILSLTEAQNVVQAYTGVLTSNVVIVLPSVVQVYYVSNQTSGAFSMTFKNAVVGSTVPLPQGQTAILFSDGTNVINASTSVSGLSSFSFGAGTLAAPAVAIGSTTTGFYSPGSGQVAFSSNGTQTFQMTAAGAAVAMATNANITVQSTGANAFLTAARPAGAFGGVQYNTNSSPRWLTYVDNAAESGTNVGSNFQIQSYDDAGLPLGVPLAINRKTGLVTVSSLRSVDEVGEIRYFLSDAVGRAGFLHLGGALVSRTAYADLFAFAVASGLVSEAAWATGQYGRFSVGDGSTTFRLPDLRGLSVRTLDAGRGVDAGRAWGVFQDSSVLSHTHSTSDPGHAHGVNDPSHAHSVSDPGHAHSISDPGHSHSYTRTDPSGQFAQNAFNWSVFNNQVGAATSGSGTGIGINGAGANIGIFGNFTGISINGNNTGVTVLASGFTETRVKNLAYPAYTRY